jgi:hypothetical protein
MIVLGGDNHRFVISPVSAFTSANNSQSYLAMSSSGTMAKFHGNLDIQTLGGAGFASQRTKEDDRDWDVSSYDGIEIIVSKSDSTYSS